MLDLLGIVFSGGMMIFVMLRAMQLDAKQEWFQRLPTKAAPDPSRVPDPAAVASRPRWRRQS